MTPVAPIANPKSHTTVVSMQIPVGRQIEHLPQILRNKALGCCNLQRVSKPSSAWVNDLLADRFAVGECDSARATPGVSRYPLARNGIADSGAEPFGIKIGFRSYRFSSTPSRQQSHTPTRLRVSTRPVCTVPAAIGSPPTEYGRTQHRRASVPSFCGAESESPIERRPVHLPRCG